MARKKIYKGTSLSIMDNRRYYVYILTNARNTVLYIGMTGDIERRLREHRAGQVEGFSKRYRLKKLVYLETFSEVRDALYREKQLKNWHRDWKLNLIKRENPAMEDLAADWFEAMSYDIITQGHAPR